MKPTSKATQLQLRLGHLHILVRVEDFFLSNGKGFTRLPLRNAFSHFKHFASGLMSRSALRTRKIRVWDKKDSLYYLTSDNDGVAKFPVFPQVYVAPTR
jgi:hypothetical protein